MRKSFVKIFLAFVLCVTVALNHDCFGVIKNASADSVDNFVSAIFSVTVEHYHSLKATAVDKTTDKDGFLVDVNIANTTSLLVFCNEPVSWTLEWQALRPDKTTYTSGKEIGVFRSTVASNTKSIHVPALKYGYLRYRLVIVSHGEMRYSEWGLCEATYYGGGDGHIRSERIGL